MPRKTRIQFPGALYHVIAHEETDIELPLEQLALNLTNDPTPVRFDGKPPVFRPEEIRLASIGSLVGILSQTVVANTSSPKVYYYLNDHLGTPQIMTDKDGGVVWKTDYKPFGEATVDPGSLATNNFRFAGQYYDGETGLHYNYYRYYDPKTGRYLRADPSHFKQSKGANTPSFVTSSLKKPQELNPFSYTRNNPLNYTDPKGLSTCQKELIECTEEAWANEIICLESVSKGYLYCLSGCAIGCTVFGPAYLECFGVCTTACTIGGGAAAHFCHAVLLDELINCGIEHYKCKKGCEG